MAQWDIPHDEDHRFLRWGPRDDIFKSWCSFFDSKNIPYEVGGGGEHWTLYKHQLYKDVDKKETSRCCPMNED